MEATELLNTLAQRGIEVSINGDKLRLSADESIPPELVAAVKSHKEELIQVLAVTPNTAPAEIPHKPSLVEGKTPEWHAQEVARLVIQEGVCLFWAEATKALIAFVRDDSFRKQVPSGVICYSVAEIEMLWSGGTPTESQRRLIDEVKRRDGDARITGH